MYMQNKYTYTFDNWYTTNDETGVVDDLSNVIANRNVYARYIDSTNKYIVRFNANYEGANPKVKEQTMIYNKSEKLAENTFTREGYTFKNWNINADGTGDYYTDKQEVTNLTSENGGIVNLYAQWNKNPDPEPEIGNVVVLYQDMEGKKIAESVTISGEVGKSYSTKDKKKEITGYEFIEIVGTETGAFQETNQFIIYKYKKIEQPKEERGKVTVKYQDENGMLIKNDVILEGKVGENYKTEKAKFDIYEFVEVVGEEEGKYTKEDKIVIYKYNKKIGRVIIIYSDPDGEKIKENDIVEGKIDTDYKLKRQAIDGYELIEVIGNEEGKFTLVDQFVSYKYKKIEKHEIMPQTGQTRIAYIAVGIIIIMSICGLIYIKWDNQKNNRK